MSSPNSTTTDTTATTSALDKSVDKSSSDTNSSWRAAARQNQAVLDQSDTTTATAVPYLPTTGVDSTTAPATEQVMNIQDPYTVPQVDITGNHDTVITQGASDTTQPESVTINGNHDKVINNTVESTNDSSDDWSTSNGSSQSNSSSAVNVNVNGSDGSAGNSSTVNVNLNNGWQPSSQGDGSTVNVNVNTPSANSADWGGGSPTENTVNVNVNNNNNEYAGSQNEGNAVNVNVNSNDWTNNAQNTTETLNLTGNNQTFNVNMPGMDPTTGQWSSSNPGDINFNVTGNGDTVNINWGNSGPSGSTGDGGSSGSSSGNGWSGGSTGGGGSGGDTGGGGSGGAGGTGGDGGAAGYQGPPDDSTNPEMVKATQEMTAGAQTLAQIQSDPTNSQLYTNQAETDFSQAETDLDQAALQLGLPMPTQSALLQGDQNGNLSADQRLAAYQGDAPGQTYDELAYDGRLASHEEQGDGAIESNGPQGDIFMQTLMNGQNNGQAAVFLDNPQDAQYFLQAMTQSIGTDGQINGDFLKQVTADTYYAGTGTDIMPILNQQPTLEADNSPSTMYASFPDPTQPGFFQTLSNDSGWSTGQSVADALWGHLQTSLGTGQITDANAADFLANADSPSDFIDQPLIDLSSDSKAAYEALLNSQNPGQALDNAFLGAIGQSYGISDLPDEAAALAGGSYV